MLASVDRIVLLGLDGATMRVLGPMFERGVMPNLCSLWMRSCHGSLVSTLPMVTPVAWTSFLTGCEPHRHGIHEFFHVDSSRRFFRPNSARQIQVCTLWQVLGDLGRSVVSLNLPMTYPAPAIPGLIISGNDSPSQSAAIATCPEFVARLSSTHPGFTTRNLWKSRPRSLESLEQVLRKTEAQFESLAEAAMRADAEIDWTVLMVQFQNLDGLLHRAWPELDLGDGPAPEQAANQAVQKTLHVLDSACGRIMELASKRGAAVVALSDHGFGPCRSIIHVNGLLQAGGYQKGLAYGTRAGYRFHRLLDRWQRYRQTSRGGERSRSIRGEIGCNWRRSVAFAPFGQLSACVYLNITDHPESSKADRLRTEIAEYLKQCRHPDTNELLFTDSFNVADRYGFDPTPLGIPDVLAGSVDGHQAQSKWDPHNPSLWGVDRGLPGTHYQEGVVALNAPGLEPHSRLAGRLADIAPTVLSLLGIDVPASMEGISLLSTRKTEASIRSPQSSASKVQFDAAHGESLSEIHRPNLDLAGKMIRVERSQGGQP